MMLQITELGLGSTWVGSFNPSKAREILKVPENFKIVNLLPLGYPAEDALPSTKHEERKELQETAFWNEF